MDTIDLVTPEAGQLIVMMETIAMLRQALARLDAAEETVAAICVNSAIEILSSRLPPPHEALQ